MIVVEMTLHSAITHQATQLAKVYIVNDGTGTQARGNYEWTVFGKRGRVLKIGRVSNWPRKSKTAIALLQKVINEAYPKGE